MSATREHVEKALLIFEYLRDEADCFASPPCRRLYDSAVKELRSTLYPEWDGSADGDGIAEILFPPFRGGPSKN